MFEQQLIYAISVNSGKDCLKRNPKVDSKNKWEDRKKYCLHYNQGKCAFDDSHDGKLNGQQVFKLHICKRCLVEEGKESRHPEKDCPSGRK